MAPSSAQSGLPSTDYYAPNFSIEVEDRELDSTSKGDVLEVKVVMGIDEITSVQLRFNNWDDSSLSFKYSDTDTLDIGRRLHLQMGYADRMVSMFDGLVTTLAPKFPHDGSPTIEVTAHDRLFLLKDSKPKEGEERKFSNMSDWKIAQLVAARNGLACKVTEKGPTHVEVVQKNQDDAKFLKERAARIDFELYIQTDPDSGEDTLYFVQPTDGRDGEDIRVYQFEWGKNLISFTPTLTLAEQVSKVTVRGWDPATKQAIVATAVPEDLPDGDTEGTTGPAAIAKLGEGSAAREECVVDAPVASEQEARELAVALLRERAYEFIKGSGKTIGIPDLRPGDNVELKGLGKRFSGRYFVTKVEHTLGAEGYQTQFDVRKFVDGGTT
jgi:phage protein D